MGLRCIYCGRDNGITRYFGERCRSCDRLLAESPDIKPNSSSEEFQTDGRNLLDCNPLSSLKQRRDKTGDTSNSQQCPTVCVEKKEGGYTPSLHNQPRISCESEQLDEDGSSSLNLKEAKE